MFKIKIIEILIINFMMVILGYLIALNDIVITTDSLILKLLFGKNYRKKLIKALKKECDKDV